MHSSHLCFLVSGNVIIFYKNKLFILIYNKYITDIFKELINTIYISSVSTSNMENICTYYSHKQKALFFGVLSTRRVQMGF